jgi:hypothetical protein
MMVSKAGPTYGFPHQLLTKLRYHDTLTITSTAGSLAKYVFRWNSTFDPDFTGTGHQPLYRDTFAGIYDQYAVVSAIAVVKFANTSGDPWVVGVLSEDDATSSTTISVLCEQATGQHKLLPPVTGSLSSGTFNASFDAKKRLGIDPFTSELYKTAVGSNPTEESDLVIWGYDTSGGSSTVTFDIELVQTVLWTELTSPTQS